MYQPAVLLSLLASLALTVTASPDQAASHHKIDSYGIQRRGHPLMISLITATRSSAGPANATTSASNARVTSLLNSTAILNGAISTSFANSTTSVTTSDAPPTTEPSTTVLYVTASSTSSPTLNSATSGAVRSRALEAVASLGLAVAIGLAVM
ncbi:hypothetical protein T439DRAFT_36499 [Meredithblackwellia eburnea MCA 4105]